MSKAVALVGRMANAPFGMSSFTKGKAADTLKISALTRGWGVCGSGGFLDGNLSHSHWLKPKKPENIVGTDEHGNVYMEDMTAQYGRHRWVLYSNHDSWHYVVGPSTIPPEWHSWLHHMTDAKGPEHLKLSPAPAYVKPAAPANTGYVSEKYYVPKGHLRHDKPRGWKKYNAWTPGGK